MSRGKCSCNTGCPAVLSTKRHGCKKQKKVHEEQVMYYNRANVLGYTYDYLYPSLTVNAGGYHFQ